MACIAYNNPSTSFLSFHENQFTKSFSLNHPSFPVFDIKPERWNPIHSSAVIRESYLFSNSSRRLSSFFGKFKRFSGKSEKSSCICAISNDSFKKAPEERLVVLVIGGGGREHALCYALQRSPSVDAVFCSPGNPGISRSGNATCVEDLDISDSSAVISFCRERGVGLVVVGPEVPLVAGLSNDLNKAGIPTFGPSAEAAALEGSKDFMKRLCYKYGIPTAKRFSGKSEKSSCICAISNDSFKKAPEERLVVLVIGGGGREHALCYALQRSPSVDAVFCSPGNPGISRSGNATCVEDLDISDSSAVISFCRERGVGLVVVGPEVPLVAGLSNDLNKAGIPTFGPSAEAAALEGSKDFMKRLCYKYGIPTAKYQTFTDPSTAKQYIQEQGVPIVIKADGLAAGKGVVVAMTLDEAYEAVDSMLVKGVFGSAGCRVIIGEFLEGEEASFFALVDGETAIPLESAQDHKRVGDGDTGPNTGGMGAYSPAPIVTEDIKSFIMKSIILPTVKGMSEEGCKFVGVLFAGLMIEKRTGLPKLIEYNVRFGDPECQVLMVRLESDLAQALLAACRGELNNVSLEWSPYSAMVVVMASKGYPGKYTKDTVIQNLEYVEEMLKEEEEEVKVFHAGTSTNSDGDFIAVGGRVLGVTATGKDLKEARDKAYQTVEKINWPEGFFRRDIGWRALP